MLSSRLSLTTSQNFEDDTTALRQFLSIFTSILKSIIGWSKKRENITVCTLLKKRPLYLPLGQKTAILCLNLKNALRCADRGHSITTTTIFGPFLTSPSSTWTIFTLTKAKIDIFWLPSSSCPRSFWTTPNWSIQQVASRFFFSSLTNLAHTKDFQFKEVTEPTEWYRIYNLIRISPAVWTVSGGKK